MDRRTYLITGANSGLGLAMTRALTERGARVVMAVRSEESGRAAQAELPAGADTEVRHLNLADLDSVHEFVDKLGEPVDVLVNNAGIMMPPRAVTRQGNEEQFATNHLGHFALTGLLLPRLRTTQQPRVVTVSSGLHRRGHIHWDDLDGAKDYSPTAFYAQSKFANVLFGLELDRRLRAAGSPVRSVLAHPGYAATNLQRYSVGKVMDTLIKLGNRFMAQTPEQGARAQLYAATDPDVAGGQFIGPGGMGEMRGAPKVVQPVASATDPELARRFWALSEELTGVTYDLPEGPTGG